MSSSPALPHKMQFVGQSARASRRRLLSTNSCKRG